MKNQMKLVFLAISSLLATSCGKTDRVFFQTETVEVAQTQQQVDEIARVVQDTNDLRISQGQLPISQGLSCTLHTGLSTALTAFPTSLPSAVATFTYVGEFNQPNSSVATGLNVIPSSIRSLYTQWYALRCSGQLVIADSDYYSFDLTSDDASLLYLNNVKIVDNDGNHGAITKSGMRFLSRGIHTFRLDYMQGPAGNQALILKMNGQLLSRSQLYR